MSKQRGRDARHYNELLRQRRAELGYDDAPLPTPAEREVERQRRSNVPFERELPDWVLNFEKLDELSKRAWDERVRRDKEGIATDEDVETQVAAKAALTAGRPLPARARRMPGPPLERSRSSWVSSQPEQADLATRIGIPPLIAERITTGDGFETRSTRACALVGRQYLILVLVGERGCGKTFAAAKWLWTAQHIAPAAIPKSSLAPRRFVEAVSYADVPFDERTRVGRSLALVLDDVGTEKDFLVNDIATLLVARYKNALATVVTTNLSDTEFGERYGMRLMDRMREVGRFLVVSNDAGDSLRGGT